MQAYEVHVLNTCHNPHCGEGMVANDTSDDSDEEDTDKDNFIYKMRCRLVQLTKTVGII